MKKFNIKLLFLVKLTLFIPIIVTVIVTNYLVNSVHNKLTATKANITAKLFLKKNVEAIYTGKEINNEGEFALIAKDYITGLSTPKEIVVFGSSRSRQIRSSDLSIKSALSFFNCSFPGETLMVMMGLYSIFRTKKMIPKTIILELSPWFITKRRTSYHTENILKNEYNHLCNCLEIDKHNDDFLHGIVMDDFERIFSFKFFQLCLHELIGIRWGRGSNVSTNFAIDALTGFKSFNKNLIVEFEAFIKLLHKEHVRIIFFLAPYHPLLYKRIATPEYEIALNVQEYFINFAQKNNIEIVGSYNPTTSDCNEADFEDLTHPRETSTRKIFKNIRF